MITIVSADFLINIIIVAIINYRVLKFSTIYISHS